MTAVIKTTWRHSSRDITEEFSSRGKDTIQQTCARKIPKIKVNKGDVTRTPRSYRKPKPLTVNGVAYVSVAAACAALDICEDTVRVRLRKVTDRNINIVKKYKISDLIEKELIIDDISYSGIREAALELKVSEAILIQKINKVGSTTIAHRVRSNSTPVVIDGVKYASVILASQRTGVPYYTVARIAKEQMSK